MAQIVTLLQLLVAIAAFGLGWWLFTIYALPILPKEFKKGTVLLIIVVEFIEILWILISAPPFKTF